MTDIDSGDPVGLVKVAAPFAPTVHEIYKDGLQPAVRQVGKSLETVAKTVNVALLPLIVFVWGFEKIQQRFINEEVAEKLKDVPPEKIQTPDAHVAGPLIEAVRFTGEKDDLRDMFANLLATAMNKDTADRSHPSFVEAIKQMTSHEAKLMELMSKTGELLLIDVRAHSTDPKNGFKDIYLNFCDIQGIPGADFQRHVRSYIDNLCRLRLLEIPFGLHKVSQKGYDELFEKAQQSPYVLEAKAALEHSFGPVTLEKELKFLQVTEYGRLFCQACLPTFKR